MKKTPLSAVIIAYNEEAVIGNCLRSLAGLADEIVVVDSHSSDRTAGICASEGCRVLQREFTGFSEQKQFAVDQASHDWVLSIDADEEITPQLKEEILRFLGRDGIPVAGCYLKRDLVYMGRRLRFGRNSGQRILRLFDRRRGRFNGAPVHEKVVADGPVMTLRGRFLHNSFRDPEHHMMKIREYALKAAEANHRKGKKYPAIWVPLKFAFSFLHLYLLRGSFLDGTAGYRWARTAALHASLKIALTIKLNRQQDPG